MKLTPENIAKIEAVLTDWENGHTQRQIIIDYNLNTLTAFSAWVSVMRSLGVSCPHLGVTGLSKEDAASFTVWLREKRARENAERGL